MSVLVKDKTTRLGVCLDIDGVLVKDNKIIAQSPQAVQSLREAGVQFIFMTNGGGYTEASKAEHLSHLLEFPVGEDQVLLSHTPFRDLSKDFQDKRVLVVGSPGCEHVAKAYGFPHVVTTRQLLCEQPQKYLKANLSSQEKQESLPLPNTACAAAFIIGESSDWALDIQVLTDELRPDSAAAAPSSSGAAASAQQRIPLFASNADLVYAGQYSEPRFTQGAFTEAFRALFELHCQTRLKVEYCGKPFLVQYRKAECMLRALGKCDGTGSWQFVGIGDNPLSDIRGANNAGEHWRSILVRTGVWQGGEGENDETDPATLVCADVCEAVRALGII